MIASHALHQRHEQHVMVDSQVTLLEDRSQLKLVRCHLVMTSLARDSKLKSLNLKILHKGLNTIGDSTKIMVIHLLVLSTLMTHQCATSHHQVRTSRVQTLVYKEILLLPTKIHLHLLHIVIEELAHISCCLINSMKRTQQRSLIVERLTCICDEDCRDTKCIIDDEYR